MAIDAIYGLKLHHFVSVVAALYEHRIDYLAAVADRRYSAILN